MAFTAVGDFYRNGGVYRRVEFYRYAGFTVLGGLAATMAEPQWWRLPLWLFILLW